MSTQSLDTTCQGTGSPPRWRGGCLQAIPSVGSNIYLAICLFIHPSIYLIYLIYPSVYIYILYYIYIYKYLSLYLSISLSLSLSPYTFSYHKLHKLCCQTHPHWTRQVTELEFPACHQGIWDGHSRHTDLAGMIANGSIGVGSMVHGWFMDGHGWFMDGLWMFIDGYSPSYKVIS